MHNIDLLITLAGGLQFHFKELLAVRRVAIPRAIGLALLRIGVFTALTPLMGGGGVIPSHHAWLRLA